MKRDQTKTGNKVPAAFQNFSPQFIVQSPGRVNLIGEHTDYNNGFVLPAGINMAIRLQFSPNGSENICNIYSRTYEKNFSFDLNKVSRSDQQWQNYILGVVNEIQKLGKKIAGFDCIIESDLPTGAGLSSSAALECGLAFGINELFHLQMDRVTMAELSQNAEHNYVGSLCGIMDQYASILSKKGHLILLDCRDLRAIHVPVDFKGHSILLLNTMVSHSLADSEYNTRRRECEEVVAVARKKYPEIDSFREVDFTILDELKSDISEVQYRRALYVLQENDRVLQAVKALEEGDLVSFGNLMYDSHLGLRDDFEVSCKELDYLVDFSKEFDPVLGARMMGGGFGGCTINLVKKEFTAEFISKASKVYLREFGIDLQAFSVQPEGGTRIL